MGVLDPGDHSFKWDGHDQEGNIMESGIYGFEITALDQSGLEVNTETRIRGPVNRVSLDGEQPLLYVGDLPIYLSQVMDVNLPDPETE